ncbi:MAG: ferritin-like domain-containing protein [Halomonas sp.]|nr:ferritin-like domain-containing protein [Halomonas sp.]
MNAAEKHLVEWLRDAHAMEQQAEQMLKAQKSRIENYPEVAQQMEKHLNETLNQSKQLESCLARYDESASAVKSMTGKMTAIGQAASGIFTQDEIVKASQAWYTFEHMEIASYRVLVATAEAAGDVETKRICESILKEEEAMAAWLEQNMPKVVQQYIQRDSAPGVDAKH